METQMIQLENGQKTGHLRGYRDITQAHENMLNIFSHK